MNSRRDRPADGGEGRRLALVRDDALGGQLPPEPFVHGDQDDKIDLRAHDDALAELIGSGSDDGLSGPGSEYVAESAEDFEDAELNARAILADADPAAYYRALNGLVRTSHSSVLGPLPYTPALSYHNPTCVVVEPEPSTIETAELYARAAYPDFDDVLVAAFNDPGRADLLTSIYHLLFTERRNIALVTNHGQIIDIALVLAALHSAMLREDRTFGVLGQTADIDSLADRSNVLVSRMVTTRQAFSIPAIQVLQSITRIFLSVPQTASRRRAKLDPALIRSNNSLMRAELGERMTSGGQLLAMAASGSQDLTIPALMHKARAAWRQRRGDDPGEAATLHLQPLYDGTLSLMMSCRYVLPVAICLDGSTPACVVGSLTELKEKDDCHQVMDWIALAHQEATGVPTIYHWHEDDLLTQVRALLNR